MVESAFAFDVIMITRITIVLLTISYDVVIVLTITPIGMLNERFVAGML